MNHGNKTKGADVFMNTNLNALERVHKGMLLIQKQGADKLYEGGQES